MVPQVSERALHSGAKSGSNIHVVLDENKYTCEYRREQFVYIVYGRITFTVTHVTVGFSNMIQIIQIGEIYFVLSQALLRWLLWNKHTEINWNVMIKITDILITISFVIYST